ncbi:hypothetical protein N656DRAFT_266149 [Canariomyces notabilis]|uniref:Uncharacterized protein n=1 Tax=Canariomyces notabilis TaxID=2074819 RepID=A0AAN6TLZ4_9PEZI|nr:hypothetical protein N656DRAFT_266149 [Canariomyces arenarius]
MQQCRLTGEAGQVKNMRTGSDSGPPGIFPHRRQQLAINEIMRWSVYETRVHYLRGWSPNYEEPLSIFLLCSPLPGGHISVKCAECFSVARLPDIRESDEGGSNAGLRSFFLAARSARSNPTRWTPGRPPEAETRRPARHCGACVAESAPRYVHMYCCRLQTPGESGSCIF